MNALELIDRLCAVAEAQAKIIREQAFFIENCRAVDAEARRRFAALRDPVTAELDLLEYKLRPIHNTGCGKEFSDDELDLSTAGSHLREAARITHETEV